MHSQLQTKKKRIFSTLEEELEYVKNNFVFDKKARANAKPWGEIKL